MYRESSRGEWVLFLAVLAALIAGVLAFLAGYWLFLPTDIAFYLAVFVAAIAFILIYYLVKGLFPRERYEMACDDPIPGSSIVDEGDEDIPIYESVPDESSRPIDMPGIDEAFAEVAGVIENEFNPQIIRDEAELKNRLFTLLSGDRPGRVRKDVPAADGTLDITLDDAYGIRLAVVRDEDRLASIGDEIAFYAENCKNVAIVLFIDRLIAPQIDLEKYTEKFDQYGALVIIKQGMIEAL